MNLAKLALDNSRITISGILIVVFVGVASFLSHPRAEDPTVRIREVHVSAFFPGMSPDRVEELITKPLEGAMREIAEIDEIVSTSKTGSVVLKVQIHDRFTDLAPIYQKIRNEADNVRPDLPEGTAGPFVNDDVGLTAIATIALWADGFSLAEMRDVAHHVRDLLYTLDGVRKIEILGVQEERIYLESTPGKLAQLGVPPADVFGALAEQNIIEPGGEIVADGRTLLLEASGNLKTVDEIRDVVFLIPDTERVLRLDEVLTVRRDLVDPPEFPSFYNDHPTIVLSVSTVDGTNNVEFGDRLTEMVEDIEQELPVGYVLDYATFQPELIAASVDNAVSNVYQTLGIVLVVVMVFLGLRTGLIVGFFVPLTMLLGLIIMRLADVELQRMSIAATIIALGLLVDNGIVVAEDIRVRLARGVDRLRAAAESSRTLAIPLLTSSLTTIFAFLPMLLIQGSSGEFIRSLAQVVAILLLGSWFLSMTVTPTMCAWFMKAPAPRTGSSEATYDGVLYVIYRRILGAFLKWRFLAIGALVGLLVLSLQLLGTVRTEFFPLGDRNQL
ncbi:MAG: efflux RND transporter permease subunit, partial [Alphaproteobacteria bacterium]|nr:efflux RND transporter permease subunit [Alphaproteobacteria bacterium]